MRQGLNTVKWGIVSVTVIQGGDERRWHGRLPGHMHLHLRQTTATTWAAYWTDSAIMDLSAATVGRGDGAQSAIDVLFSKLLSRWRHLGTALGQDWQ